MPTERAPHNMTADSAPSPYVAAASSFFNDSGNANPFRAFDGSAGGYGTYWISNGTSSGWLSIDMGSGNTFVITDYNVVANTIPEPNRAPRDWTLEGSNNNSTWTTLDTRSSQTSWSSGQNRHFTCNGGVSTAFRYFRLNVTANNGDSYLVVAELYLQGEPPGDAATIAGAESGDAASVSSSVSTGASVAAVESADSATLLANPRPLTFYLKDAVPAGAVLHRALQEGGTPPADATTGTGWRITAGPTYGRYSLRHSGSILDENAFGATAMPAVAPSQTYGDCSRSENPISGTFDNADWTFTWGRAAGGVSTGASTFIRMRLWKSTDPNGVGATELTTSAVTVTFGNGGPSTFNSNTWSPGGAVTLANEYLFVQTAIDAAGNLIGAGLDFVFLVGAQFGVVTSSFTPAAATSSAIAATESADSASLSTTVQTGASIAAVESPDSASLTVANWVTAQLAALDSSDNASIAGSATTGAAIAATESPDGASLAAANWTNAAVAATESPDSASISAADWMTAQLAALESADSSAIDATVTTGVTIAASETADSANLQAANWTTAAVDAIESPDLANISVANWVAAQIEALESADIASLTTAVTTGAAVGAVESPDNATIAADANLGVTEGVIVAGESGDGANVVAANWTTAQLAATESADNAALGAASLAALLASIGVTDIADIVAITARVTAAAFIVATESSDNAAISSNALTTLFIDPKYYDADGARAWANGSLRDFGNVGAVAARRNAS